MPFLKYGDGKVIDIVEADALTDEQKQAVKKISKEFVKQSDELTNSSNQKKLES